MTPTRGDFAAALESILEAALQHGLLFVDVSARELHQKVGEYPGRQHRMPICCRVMHDRMRADDQVLSTPASGQGASLSIRYYVGNRSQDFRRKPPPPAHAAKPSPQSSELSTTEGAQVDDHGAAVSPTAIVLIPCSNSKQRGGTAARRAIASAPNRMGVAGSELLVARTRLAALVGESPGSDLGSGDGCPALLPALDRYQGLFYRGADFTTWPAAALERFRGQALIVSGLYGLVAPDESIRYYECAMDRPLPGHGAVNHWWRGAGLGDWVRAYLAQVKATDLYLFLSTSYLEALGQIECGSVRVHRTPYDASTDAIRQQGEFLRRLYFEGVCEHCRRGLQ